MFQPGASPGDEKPRVPTVGFLAEPDVQIRAEVTVLLSCFNQRINIQVSAIAFTSREFHRVTLTRTETVSYAEKFTMK